MRSDYFECFVAALWQRKGFKTVYRTPDGYDEGVDEALAPASKDPAALHRGIAAALAVAARS
jgi:hypothetical protein